MGFSCLFSFNFLEDFEANTEVQLKHVHFRVSGCWLQNSSDFMKRHGKIIGKQGIKVVLLEIQPLYYLMITKMNLLIPFFFQDCYSGISAGFRR